MNCRRVPHRRSPVGL